MEYLVIGRDYNNSIERRMAHREAHLKSAESLKKEGKLIYAVAMIESGQMVGSVMIMRFASETELNHWKANEPYIMGKVWETVEISACAIPSLFA